MCPELECVPRDQRAAPYRVVAGLIFCYMMGDVFGAQISSHVVSR